MDPRRALIRQARDEKGWTQAKLAHEAGIAPATVYRIESGKHSVEDESVEACARALGIQGAGRFSATQAFPVSTGGGMGHMIGAMMIPAGSSDIYGALLKYAVDRDDPQHVTRALKAAKDRAPMDAGIDWWLDVYLTARLAPPPKR